MTEDDKQQQQNQSNVVQAISAVFQRKSAELARLNAFVEGADGTLKNIHPHMKSLEALSKQLSEKIAAEAAAKADAKYESVGLRAKAAADYLHSNVEQATKDLMASEFAMMTFGGIMTCALLYIMSLGVLGAQQSGGRGAGNPRTGMHKV
ncbi:major surface protein 1B [Anaplasma marginale str. St. Maries]|uniref:adhesin MSP1 subunit beta n=1 Tax=Anaplasma marginale TaxID=770 RepID=UPI0000497AB4|nr:hypothetical protein [Anaplasma marginale]AAV86316.1 major surface protein 1B [Anaplasma marginale str. St. Maries]